MSNKTVLSRAIAKFMMPCAFATIATASVAIEPPVLTDASFMDIDALVLSAKGRPNEEARLAGLKSYKNGRYEAAVGQFERAAYYADKYSQHYLSLMNWYGVGVDKDPVQAYIWADLAAERGSKRPLAIREKIWDTLTPEQRAQVQARGEAAYARYGDEVAKPRTESVMRQFARGMTGSHLGYRNQRLDISAGPPNGAFDKPGSRNYSDVPATPDALYGEEGGLSRMAGYWKRQDALLDGNVEVGPLQTVRNDPRSGK